MARAYNCGRKTKEQVLRELDLSCNGRYSFDRDFEYTHREQKIECVCNYCNRVFSTQIKGLLGGSSCPSCSRKGKKAIRETQEQVEENLRRISKGEWTWKPFVFKNKHQKIELICLKCERPEPWIVTINQVYNSEKALGMNCKFCSRKVRQKVMTKEDIIRECNKVGGKFFQVIDDGWEYIDNKQKIPFQCLNKYCGEIFYASINNIKNHKRGCSYCKKAVSNPERELLSFIKTFYSGKIITSDRKTIPSPITNLFYEIDILLPNLKIGIEFNGKHWHSDEQIQKKTKGYFKTSKEFHDYKTNECKKLGITLLHIAEEDYLKDKESVLKELKENIIKTIDK